MKIGFSLPKKFNIASWLIRKWMKRPYSHTYVVLDNNVYHATGLGNVHLLDYTEFYQKNQIVYEYEIDLSEFVSRQIKRHCESVLGEPYSYLEIIKIMFYDIAQTFFITLKTHDVRGFICSELVGGICAKYLRMDFPKPTYLLTPADIQNALQDKYENKIA